MKISELGSYSKLSKPQNNPLFSSPILMGLELEIEGVGSVSGETLRKYDPQGYWSLINDNSLRNAGIEAVMIGPQGGGELVDSINNIAAFLATRRRKKITHRCSFHCHIDVTKRTTQDVYMLSLLFIILEASLYTISAKDRYSNIYCPGFTHSTYNLNKLHVLMSDDIHDISSLLSAWPKYSGINLAPVLSFGSVEIRTHQGTVDREDMILWVRLLNYIASFAFSTNIEQLLSLIQQGPAPLVDAIFHNEEELYESIMTDNLTMYWESGIKNLQNTLIMEDFINFNTIHKKSSNINFNELAKVL